MRKLLHSAPIAIGGVLLCSSALHAETIHVAPCGSDTWSGQNAECVAPDGPKRTIQAAINASNDEDEIVLADGAYTGSGNVNLSFDGLYITVRSASGNPAQCVIDCQDASNTVGFIFNDFETNESILEGVTIRGGNASLGGAICLFFSSPLIRNCVFRDNDASQGGGAIACTSGASPVFESCMFIDNTGAIGGAVSLFDRCDVEFDDCTFTGNIASTGGGAIDAADECDFTVTDSTFQGNGVTGTGSMRGGGAIRLTSTSRPTVTGSSFRDHMSNDDGGAVLVASDSTFDAIDCTFTANMSTSDGGAIAVSGLLATLTLTDVRFVDNSATNGGAVHSDRSLVELTRCAFTGNQSVVDGGAIHQSDGSETNILNSRFSGNLADNHGGAIFSVDLSRVTGTNVAFSGNGATFLGGAVLNLDVDDMTLTNCSFSANTAPVGGAISNLDSNVSLVNSIVSGNTGGGIVDVFGPETDASYCLIEGGWSGPGPGNINADPRWADPDGPDDLPGTDDDDLRLTTGSPCIDAADNGAPGLAGVTTDINGAPRFFDDPDTADTGNGQAPLVDMGGYEFQGNDCPIDIDGDGMIGFGDVLRILGAWGNTGGPEDVDGDNDVGFGDVLVVLAEWGPC